MQLICTEGLRRSDETRHNCVIVPIAGASSRSAGASVPPRYRLKAELRTRRGNAEIELLLLVPLLLAIMFLAGAAMGLGRARMATSFGAENSAYTQVVSGAGFTQAGAPVPPDGIDMPNLPTRYVLGSAVQPVTISQRNMLVIKPQNDQAILLDAAWHYSAWPQTADRPDFAAWFSAYVRTSQDRDVAERALGLQDPGPP